MPKDDEHAMTPDPNCQSHSTALFWTDRFTGHDTGAHVERPKRAEEIGLRLKSRGLLANRPDMYVQSVPTELLERVHDPRYLAGLERFASSGGGWIDADTYVGVDSLEIAGLAAGAAVGAVHAVLENQAPHAFALGRPPGHHATRYRAMGFCLYNSAAIAAEAAIAGGVERVAILDWDVHHGNGTQDIFYERADVLYCSVHQHPNYPGTGLASEKGSDAGRGFTVNAPLPPGQGDRVYLRLFDELFAPRIAEYEPELLIISAGFDAHHDDPLAEMQVTERGFAELTERSVDLADRVSGGRMAAVLEGGYDLTALGRSVEAMIRVLDGATPERAVAALNDEWDLREGGERTWQS
jgi:acetoin utilization deacetylase AcuC-like enzyme